MYNNFLVQKNKKIHDQSALLQKRMNNWLQKYHHKVQPHLLDKYNQRINSFITKVQQNPLELQKYQPLDIKKLKQQQYQQHISELSRKGGKSFRFRDAADFNSFFGQAQRIQRQKNKHLFEKRYGDSSMAFRSIASQSQYNPNLLNQYRTRQKSKQINPPMRYTNKCSLAHLIQRKSKSVVQNRKNRHIKTQSQLQQQNDQSSLVRKNTSKTNSVLGTQDLNRSVNSIRQGSSSSQQSRKNLKKLSVTLQNPNKQKRRQSNKSYFVGLTDIKQNSKDPHLKKTLHNILVKIGKTHPNPRDRNLVSHVQVLSGDIN